MTRVLNFSNRATRPTGITVTPETLGFTRWYRGDGAGTGAVSSWAPRTGSNTLTAAGGVRPNAAASVSFGNRTTVTFDGVDDQLTFAGGVLPLRPHTIWFCGQAIGASLAYLWGQTFSSGGVYGLMTSTSFRYEESTVVQSSATTTNTPCSLAWLVDAAGVTFVRNGIFINTVARTAVASGSGTNFALGSAIGSTYMNVEVADFAVGPLVTVADCLSLHNNYAMPYYGIAA